MSSEDTGSSNNSNKKKRRSAPQEEEKQDKQRKQIFMLVPCAFDGELEFPVTLLYMDDEQSMEKILAAYELHSDLFAPECDGCGADDACILCALSPRFMLDKAELTTETVSEAQEMLFETLRSKNQELYKLLESAIRKALKRMRKDAKSKSKEETGIGSIQEERKVPAPVGASP